MNHDSPGVNTSLNPEAAPVWMHRLVDTVRTTEQRPPTTAAKQAAFTFRADRLSRWSP